MYDIIVIGGGASGLIAGGVAAGQGKKVAIIDKNKHLARKVRITGKGRCNITNNCERDDFFRNIIVGDKFLLSAFSKFSNSDVIDFFENLGVKTKVERGGRVFPQSDSAHEIADALANFATSAGCEIIGNTSVVGARLGAPTSFEITLAGGKTLTTKSLILATGGSSYPLTGSTGDGYKFAQNFGNNIISIRPALVPLTTAEKWVRRLEGLSLKNVGVTFCSVGADGNPPAGRLPSSPTKNSGSCLVGDSVSGVPPSKNNIQNVGAVIGRPIYKEPIAELIFTDFGISGPAALSASLHLDSFPAQCVIDLKPALTHEQLDKRIQREFSENINKNFENILPSLLPKSLIPIFIELISIPSNKKIHQITAAERAKMVELLKGIKLTIIGTRPIDEAIITMGGVDTREVNPSTMESRLIHGLYFCGEILNITGYTGGFNLQIAFSTGYVAGMNA